MNEKNKNPFINTSKSLCHSCIHLLNPPVDGQWCELSNPTFESVKHEEIIIFCKDHKTTKEK